MSASNDQRGWVLAGASGLACVFGACLIYLELVVHVVPRWRHFQIQKSSTFLAAALSLSFGVMFFSALFGLLPEALEYFQRDGYRPDHAGYAAIGFFLLGVVVIQIFSELLHNCLPESVVSCEDHGKLPSDDTGNMEPELENETERAPLLRSRPSLRTRSTGLLRGKGRVCDANGKCYGYSGDLERCDLVSRCACEVHGHAPHGHHPSVLDGPEAEINGNSTVRSHSQHSVRSRHSHHSGHHSEEGHHHVPQNKFLSIGVQTTIAIVLHKFPEGFITYATNHANPKLGFTVFIALFIHNIAEGFSMCLPLFLAFQSRHKAVIWASILGGCAQPIGAAIAWAYIRNQDFEINTGLYGILFAMTAGIMCSVGLQLFSQSIQIKAGNGSGRVAFVFAFVGMGILGFSTALTAE